MSPADPFVLELADGRRLEGLTSGASDGFPLVFHSGTPTGAVETPVMSELAAERGLRVITWSRPGYGGSSRRAGRTVADVVEDTAAVLATVGGDDFVTLGWSGGGPHALACAALLADRVQGCATIGGVAPWGADGLDWLAGMGHENVEEFGATLSGSSALRAYLEGEAPALKDVGADQVADALGGLIPEVDRASLTGAFAEELAAQARAALSNGIWGWHDDDMAFLADWGFDLGAISVPVQIWQGDQDLMVPIAHGRWLAANIAGAEARLFPGEGHLSIGVGMMDRILDGLAAHV